MMGIRLGRRCDVHDAAATAGGAGDAGDGKR